MATFDQLSAEQRAIIELVLKQGQSYDQLADMLAMPTTRVRELAQEALVRLSPVSAGAVDGQWRGQLADYLLNVQSGPDQTATRGHLRRSEAARGWARSVLDSLEQLYLEGDIPTVPAGETGGGRGRRRAAPAPPPPAASGPDELAAEEARDDAEAPRARPPLQPTARAAMLAGGGALALVLLVAVIVGLVGFGPLAIGGEDGDGGGSAESTASGEGESTDAGTPRIIADLELTPVESLEGDRGAAGVAAIALQDSQRTLIVQAQLPRNDEGQAYQVWLYNSDDDALSLGAQVTDDQGAFQGAKRLPGNFESYRFIDVSREEIRGPPGHSGRSVLRGRVERFAPPAPQEQAP